MPHDRSRSYHRSRRRACRRAQRVDRDKHQTRLPPSRTDAEPNTKSWCSRRAPTSATPRLKAVTGAFVEKREFVDAGSNGRGLTREAPRLVSNLARPVTNHVPRRTKEWTPIVEEDA